MNERPCIIALSDQPNILFIGFYLVLGLKAVVSIENDEDINSFGGKEAEFFDIVDGLIE